MSTWIDAAEQGFHRVVGVVKRPPFIRKPLHKTACGLEYSPVPAVEELPEGAEVCANCAKVEIK